MGADELCGVCFEYTDGKERGVIACGHHFCFSCITRWTEGTNTCPLCKIRIREIGRPDGTKVHIREDRDREIDSEEEAEFLDPEHWISDADVRCVGDEHCRWRNGEFDRLSMSQQIELEGENCSVQCDHCAGWYHSFCVGFASREALPSEEDDWYCPACVTLTARTTSAAAANISAGATEIAGNTAQRLSAAVTARAAAGATRVLQTHVAPQQHSSSSEEDQEDLNGEAERLPGQTVTRSGRRSVAPVAPTEAASARQTNRQPLGPAKVAALELVHGSKHEERQSVFQAHMCRDCHSFAQIAQIMRAVARATDGATSHSLAYRWSMPANTSRAIASASPMEQLEEGCEDGGEDGAGEQILALLRRADARGVCLVVSRWFGGVLMGADRFRCILSVGRSLLIQEGYIGAGNLPADMDRSVALSADPRVANLVAARQRSSISNADPSFYGTVESARTGRQNQVKVPAGTDGYRGTEAPKDSLLEPKSEPNCADSSSSGSSRGRSEQNRHRQQQQPKRRYSVPMANADSMATSIATAATVQEQEEEKKQLEAGWELFQQMERDRGSHGSISSTGFRRMPLAHRQRRSRHHRPAQAGGQATAGTTSVFSSASSSRARSTSAAVSSDSATTESSSAAGWLATRVASIASLHSVTSNATTIGSDSCTSQGSALVLETTDKIRRLAAARLEAQRAWAGGGHIEGGNGTHKSGRPSNRRGIADGANGTPIPVWLQHLGRVFCTHGDSRIVTGAVAARSLVPPPAVTLEAARAASSSANSSLSTNIRDGERNAKVIQLRRIPKKQKLEGSVLCTASPANCISTDDNCAGGAIAGAGIGAGASAAYSGTRVPSPEVDTGTAAPLQDISPVMMPVSRQNSPQKPEPQAVNHTHQHIQQTHRGKERQQQRNKRPRTQRSADGEAKRSNCNSKDTDGGVSPSTRTSASDDGEKARIFGLAKPLLLTALKKSKSITRRQYKEIGAAVVRKTLRLQQQLRHQVVPPQQASSESLPPATVSVVPDDRVVELARRHISAAAAANTQHSLKKQAAFARWIDNGTVSSSSTGSTGSADGAGDRTAGGEEFEKHIVRGDYVDLILIAGRGRLHASSSAGQRARLVLRPAETRPMGARAIVGSEGNELRQVRANLAAWFEERERKAVFVTQLHNGGRWELQLIGARGFQLPGFTAVAVDTLTKVARFHEVDLDLLQLPPRVSASDRALCNLADTDALPLRRPLLLLELAGLTFVNTCRIAPTVDLAVVARRMLRELARLHQRKTVTGIAAAAANEKEDIQLEGVLVNQLRRQGSNGWPKDWVARAQKQQL